jgi:hypothetical protein
MIGEEDHGKGGTRIRTQMRTKTGLNVSSLRRQDFNDARAWSSMIKPEQKRKQARATLREPEQSVSSGSARLSKGESRLSRVRFCWCNGPRFTVRIGRMLAVDLTEISRITKKWNLLSYNSFSGFEVELHRGVIWALSKQHELTWLTYLAVDSISSRNTVSCLVPTLIAGYRLVPVGHISHTWTMVTCMVNRLVSLCT